MAPRHAFGIYLNHLVKNCVAIMTMIPVKTPRKAKETLYCIYAK